MPRKCSVLYLIITCLIILLHSSCIKNQKAEAILTKAIDMIEYHPAEALDTLNTIENPELLEENQYMRYKLFFSLAKFMNGQPVPEQDELVGICSYFEKENDVLHTAVANFLIGLVLQSKNEYIASLKWFYDAARLSEECKQDKLTAKSLNQISYAYFEQGVYSEAARQSKQALSFFKNVPNSENDIMKSLSTIGLWHYKTNQLDCALARYKEGLEVAQSINDTEWEARFKAFIGTVLGTKGETAQAIPYLEEAISAVQTTEDSLLVYKGFLQTYNESLEITKASPYAEILSRRAWEMKTKSRQRETIRELSRYYEGLGEFDFALIFRKVEAEMFADMEKEKSAEDFLTIKESYDLSLKNKDMENQKLWYLTLISSLLLVAFIICGVLYLRSREIHFKNEEKERENKLLEERVKSFEYMRSMYKGTIIRLVQMDKRVQDKIEEAKKTTGEAPVIYEEMRSLIDSLRRTTSYHYVRVAEDFIKKQPNGEELSKLLDRPNKIIFILCTLRYNQSEMASMVGLSRKSVMMRRYDIRNTLIKFGMSEKKANSIIFFDQDNGTNSEFPDE